ncbi:hypothetical protein [Leucobacter sp. M11]|uniref:hypothetical protein n=1 Tax=Leucobacter sp. M11 TaxID=2993565 RepID=UPI002D7F6A1D|nr:hypothetical protein [Leucobacter sp. M11]MEB4613135.1 hypothetical protein [Leucobacter sp. M11]
MNPTAATQAPTIRRRDVIAAEITKIITHPATTLMLAITLIANMFLALIDASGVLFFTGDGVVPARLSSFGIVMLAPLYAFLVIPVWAAATEYHGAQLRMSLVATPRRAAFVLAKLAALLLVCVVAAAIAVVPARLLIGTAFGVPPAELVLNCAQWLGVYVLMSLIAFGLAGILRNTVAPLGILIALPIVVATGILQWPEGIQFLPDQASLSLVGTPAYDVTWLPPGVAALTLLGWGMVALTGSAIAVTRRDA